MTEKLRILHVGEASFLATGYSVYSMEVMKRLHATGKYELAELACYATKNDPRAKQLPWRYYANHPLGDNRQERREFESKRTNEFGEYTFNQVCLQFRPDIVWSIRDHWMDEFIERSPLRPYYRWVEMPTVDSIPQQEQWLATFMDADAVFSYSDWGADVLRKEGGGLINVKGSASPGADFTTFYPMNKVELRRKFHFEDGMSIVGTIMRNQGRKLYPELIEAFSTFLKEAPKDIAQKTFLYLHVSYPDQGWDIPRLIKRFGVSHKTLVTYKCQRCHAVFPSFFMDVMGPCDDCGYASARMPNVQEGIDRSTLAKIINLFDVYIQYANSEGFGMPQVEAASCGIPVFATDYSAMGDIVRKVNGYPIKVKHYRMDNEFGCYRAIPDNQDLVDKLIKFFSLDSNERQRKSRLARQGVEKYYVWDKTADKWMKVFDELDINQYTWDSSPRIFKPNIMNIPNFETNEELVHWAILNVLGEPEKLNSYLSLRLIRDLNWGLSQKIIADGNYANEYSFVTRRNDLKNFTPDDMIKELSLMCENRNKWEQRRIDFIKQGK